MSEVVGTEVLVLGGRGWFGRLTTWVWAVSEEGWFPGWLALTGGGDDARWAMLGPVGLFFVGSRALRWQGQGRGQGHWLDWPLVGGGATA